MFVIARRDVVDHQGRCLIGGKSYQAICYYTQSPTTGNWSTKSGEFIIPRNPEFYIRVVREDGREYDYWNDYFLSTDEVRQLKLEKLI